MLLLRWGHYIVCEKILNFAKQLGVREIITIGGFAEGKEVQNPKVIGAVNDSRLLKKYKKYNIDFGVEHSVGTIVGASGLLIGMAKLHGMHGLCLMGETVGLPLLTDPKAAEKVLESLKKVLGVKIDIRKLENTIKKMESKIKQTEDIHKKMLDTVQKDDQVKYIG
ncbi:MAG: PAC2 family protein [Candidatus Aenigmarchaeota archaeon]|nr:PAC2 family protein [Candidatus Aenigmarchaeota archaeon]